MRTQVRFPRSHIKEASVLAHTCNSWGVGNGDLGSLVASQLHGISEVQATKKASMYMLGASGLTSPRATPRDSRVVSSEG